MILILAFAMSPIGLVIALVVGLVAAAPIYAWNNFEGSGTPSPRSRTPSFPQVVPRSTGS
jgi:hypothetical protein